MKKNFLAKASLLSAAVVLTTGCTGGKHQIVCWTSFGSEYSGYYQVAIDSYNQTLDEKVEVKNEPVKGGYDELKKKIDGSVGPQTYPNFANGYPDHFASYIKAGIQIPMDNLIETYNKEHAAELAEKGYTSIMDDYYDDYMEENLTLRYKPDGTGYVMGLPFNKSTEVLGYNGYLFDFVNLKYQEDHQGEVFTMPQTYADWLAKGPIIRSYVLDNLAGKVFFGAIGADKHLTAWDALPMETGTDGKPKDPTAPEGMEKIFDMTDVNADNFIVLSWDALDNMFITLVRQFGGQYTSYTAEDAASGHGWATFWDDNNKAATREALKTVVKLHDAQVFKHPMEIEGNTSSFASDLFKKYKTFAMVCSSGGLSYNVVNNSKDQKWRFRMSEIPYQDAEHKYVISQGTNLGLFKQGSQEDIKIAFEAMLAITTGELQGEWAYDTGYFPASKSAFESEAYQALYDAPDAELDKVGRELDRAHKEAAVLNKDSYMNDASEWHKFTDPGFVGSSDIRGNMDDVIKNIVDLKESDYPSESSYYNAIETVMRGILRKIATYVKE